MFPCTLSILKPIHTDYFPKQTRAFQADKGISGRKETDWKRLTVRFASKKQKKHILPFIAESKNILSGIFGHLWNSRKRLIHDSVIHWNKPTPLVRKFKVWRSYRVSDPTIHISICRLRISVCEWKLWVNRVFAEASRVNKSSSPLSVKWCLIKSNLL